MKLHHQDFKNKHNHVKSSRPENTCDSGCESGLGQDIAIRNARVEIMHLPLHVWWLCSIWIQEQRASSCVSHTWRRRNMWLSMPAQAQKPMHKQIHAWQTFRLIVFLYLALCELIFMIPKSLLWSSGQCTSAVAGGISSPFQRWHSKEEYQESERSDLRLCASLSAS